VKLKSRGEGGLSNKEVEGYQLTNSQVVTSAMILTNVLNNDNAFNNASINDKYVTVGTVSYLG